MSTEEGTQARWQTRRAVDALSRTLRGRQEPLSALEAVRHARDGIEDVKNLWIDAARRSGATYAEIGRALGITRQAVRQAEQRRRAHEDTRAELKAWRLPLPIRRPRWRWLPRRAA